MLHDARVSHNSPVRRATHKLSVRRRYTLFGRPQGTARIAQLLFKVLLSPRRNADLGEESRLTISEVLRRRGGVSRTVQASLLQRLGRLGKPPLDDVARTRYL